MTSKVEVSGVCVCSIGALIDSTQMMHLRGQTSNAIDAVIGDAKTVYAAIFVAPFTCRVKSAIVCSVAKETSANSTIKLYKCPTGVALPGTLISTSIAATSLVNNTNKALAILSTGVEVLDAGDILLLQVVSGAATSTLKHINVMVTLRREL